MDPNHDDAPSATDWIRLRGDHPLVVYVDLKSPYAYLAIAPTRAMAQARGVPIDWRPFTLDIPSYLGSAKLDKQGKVDTAERTKQQWSGVRYSYMDARRYANLTGKTVRGTVKIWDSSLAGISMLWAKRAGRIDDYIDTVYPPFWRRDLDIDDIAVLESSLSEAGIDVDGFRAFADGPGRAEHDALNEAAFAAGIFGVPTYLVGEEMWFGREHLPRVDWLLGGSAGAAPDVGNVSFGLTCGAAEAATTDPNPPVRTGLDTEADLTVLLDLRHPASALALEPAAALGEELKIDVDWLPRRAPPLKAPSQPAPGDDRSVMHRRHRARHIAREIDVYGHAQGLALERIYRDDDPTAFEHGWLWLRGHAPSKLLDYLRASLRAWWAGTLDPSDVDVVADLLSACDCDATAFRSWATESGAAEGERITQALEERGVGGVPGYLVDGEFFQGRQHLPMIRWILGGRVGPGPI